MLSVVEYVESHLDDLEPNRFSSFHPYRQLIGSDLVSGVSMVNEEGVVKAIPFWFEYSPSKYSCFILMAEDFEPRDAVVVKAFVKETFLSYNMSRLETLSVDCELLNRWHKFIGFEHEGTKRNYVGDTDYNMWSIVDGN